jgi:hypothetical protein
MCDNLVALLRGRPPNLGIDGLPRPDFGVAEPYTIPSAPGPGVDDVPRVILCWLPGGMMLACPVPQLAASEVRQEIARALRVQVEALREHALLFCDLRWPGSLEVWSETTPLPDAFFCPTYGVRQCCGCGRRSARNPTLRLCRLRPGGTVVPTAIASSEAAPSLVQQHGAARTFTDTGADAALAFLDSEAALEDLRRGDSPADACALAELAALALLLGTGLTDVLHSQRLLRRTLPTLAPSLHPRRRELLAATAEDVLRNHAQASSEITSELADGPLSSPLSSLAARRRLLERLREVLPLVRLDVLLGEAPRQITSEITSEMVGEAPRQITSEITSEMVGEAPRQSMDLAQCLTLAGSLRGGSRWRRRQRSIFLTVGENGVALLDRPVATGAVQPSTRVDARRLELRPLAWLPWRAITSWRTTASVADAIELVLVAPAELPGLGPLQLSLGHQRPAGPSTKLCFYSAQAALVGCLLTAHGVAEVTASAASEASLPAVATRI